MLYNFIKIAIGIFFVGMGICDICKRRIRWGYSDNMKPKEREVWQRWLGVVELVVGLCDILYIPFAGMQRVTSALLATIVLVLRSSQPVSYTDAQT